jgi:hypothetical protein
MSPNTDEHRLTVCEFAALLRAAIMHQLGATAVIEERPNVIAVPINHDKFRVSVERSRTDETPRSI